MTAEYTNLEIGSVPLNFQILFSHPLITFGQMRWIVSSSH